MIRIITPTLLSPTRWVRVRDIIACCGAARGTTTASTASTGSVLRIGATAALLAASVASSVSVAPVAHPRRGLSSMILVSVL